MVTDINNMARHESPFMWEQIANKKNAKIWRQEVILPNSRALSGNKAYTYRAIAHFDDPIDLVFNAIVDISNRMDWDASCKEMRRIRMVDETEVT
jgi:hypothetical protein